ncbi:Transcriptional regulator, AraC family [Labilithrix luteola]|uniref:Transcriptional regulator, AraC family n=1 Tax=Labilithrix luteola TaxID=1391654 RepID=A0A0K1Q000_9BACT|nr:AraC family transcriptional regulator [Labilithrix luteola]AKU98709.1 Transcriptional regulator, AraC family [Labilithrix luteola]
MPTFLSTSRATTDSNLDLASAGWSYVEHDGGALEVLEVRGGGAKSWCFLWPHRMVVQALSEGVTFTCDERTAVLPTGAVLVIESFGARTKIDAAPGGAFRALFEIPSVENVGPSRARLHAPRVGPVLALDLAAPQTFIAAVAPTTDVLCIGRVFGPVARARAYIEENVEKDFDLETLSAAAGVERSYLCRLFQRTMGLPPYRFRTHLRVAHARKLLAAGADCTDVTYTLGFCDQSHLTRCFKELTGTTPGAYARACRASRSEWTTSPAAA